MKKRITIILGVDDLRAIEAHRRAVPLEQSARSTSEVVRDLLRAGIASTSDGCPPPRAVA